MFAENLKQTAIELINKYGNDMTLRNIVKGEYDPSTGKVPPDTETDFLLKGTFENYSSEEIKGSIQQGDIKIIIATDEIPKVNDIILFNAVKYTIINIMPSISQNTVVIYEMQARL